MRHLTISPARLAVRAQRQCSRDHQLRRRAGEFVWRWREYETRDFTPLAWWDIRIESLTYFDRTYSGTPDDIGEIELTYDREGHRAIYGFTAEGILSIYAD